MLDTCLNVSKDFVVKYKVLDNMIFFESKNCSNSRSFIYNVRFTESRLLNLKNYNKFVFLYSLFYVYEDILRDIKNGNLSENSKEFVKRADILMFCYGNDFLLKVSLLSKYLSLYKSCKVNASVEGHDLDIGNCINFKYVFRYKSKQYTFFRNCNRIDNLSIKELCDLEYNEVLKELRYYLVNRSSNESILYKKYYDILGIYLSDYVRISLFYNNIN